MTRAQRRALFVVGMHRSGTSALTGVLQLLGVELGDRLMPARAGVNDKGFFEHSEIFRVHDALLDSLGSSWDDFAALPDGWWRDERVKPFRLQLDEIVVRDFGGAAIWGLKDPRLCKTLPMWRELLAAHGVELCPVLIGRAPDEVVESLRKVRGFEPVKSRALWLRHVLDSERATRGMTRVVVTYDQLLKDWSAVVARIDSAFALSWPRPPASVAAQVREFLDPQLRRSQKPAVPAAGEPSRPSHEAARTDAAWLAFQQAAAGDAESLPRRLDEIAAVFDDLVALVRPIAASLRRELGESRRLAERLTEMKELAAGRDQELARSRAELAQTRSRADSLGVQLETTRETLMATQAVVAAANASIRRRRRLLRKVRKSLAWRLLRAWRALRRGIRRARRV